MADSRASEPTITADEAMMKLNDHLGQEVRLRVNVTVPPGGPDLPFDLGSRANPLSIITFTGELGTVTSPHSGESVRDFALSLYTIGDQQVHLGLLPGSIVEARDGVDFRLAEGLVLDVRWRKMVEKGRDVPPWPKDDA